MHFMDLEPPVYPTTKIIETVHSAGADLAGIVDVATAKTAPSYDLHPPEWPPEVHSVLVFAIRHDIDHPDLDWWDDRPGGTPGNRLLMKIAETARTRLEEIFGITARPLPYHVERGGVYLKDLAVMAGLGVIGKNNLLITRRFGPRVRLRAMFFAQAVPPTPPISFDPCRNCDAPCIAACPRRAFPREAYARNLCRIQMKADCDNRYILPEYRKTTDDPDHFINYCRRCELACPVGR
jgi:epoxyqueuosine reductase